MQKILQKKYVTFLDYGDILFLKGGVIMARRRRMNAFFRRTALRTRKVNSSPYIPRGGIDF